MTEPYPYLCIHCGQAVNDDGADPDGYYTCGENAADEDMQNEEHDFDRELL